MQQLRRQAVASRSAAIEEGKETLWRWRRRLAAMPFRRSAPIHILLSIKKRVFLSFLLLFDFFPVYKEEEIFIRLWRQET